MLKSALTCGERRCAASPRTQGVYHTRPTFDKAWTIGEADGSQLSPIEEAPEVVLKLKRLQTHLTKMKELVDDMVRDLPCV